MIEIKNLSKTYNKNKVEVKALKDISLKLPAQGLVFIVGRSGSGKSTLLNVLGALDSFDTGDIIVENKSMKEFNEQDSNNYRNSYVGFVFQDFNLIDDYNLEKNIALGLNLGDSKEDLEKINEILRQVDLEGMGKRKPNTISGGQKQRVAIARALIKKPNILLCDEPTGQLDFETGESIFNLLKEISKNNLVVIVSHDMESAETYGDRIITLRDGKLERDTAPLEEIKTNKNIELKEYKLSVKRQISLALGFLKKRPLRLLIALFIAVLTFILFCVSDSIGSYNKNQAILNSMYENENEYISFHKMLDGKDDEGNETSIRSNMNDEDIEFIKAQVPVDNYHIIYDFFSDETYNLTDTIDMNSDYYKNQIQGISELTDDFLKTYNYELYGKKPEKDSEVVITKYAYEMYKEFGHNEDGVKTKINSMDDLIGKEILFFDFHGRYCSEFIKLSITGILDTKFNYERYREVLTSKDINLHSSFNVEINYIMNNSFHNVLFFKEGFYNDNIIPLKNSENELNFGRFNLAVTTYGHSIQDGSQYEQIDNYNRFKNIKKYDELSNIDVYWKDEQKVELSDDEVIVPLSLFFDQNKYAIDEKVQKFAWDNFKDINSNFDYSAEYGDYIINNEENEYQPEYNYKYFENEFYQTNFVQVKEIVKSNLNNYNLFDTSSYDVKIVGFYNDYNHDYRSIYVSNNFISKFRNRISYLINDYKCVVVPLTNSYNNDIKYFNFSDKTFKSNVYDSRIDITFENYLVENEIVLMVNDVEADFEVVNMILKYVSLGVSLLVVAFIAFYFSGVIIDKEKEIGILRALGASKRDITKIFLIESVMILLISILISIIASLILLNIVNNYTINNYYLINPLYQFGIRQICLLLLIETVILMIGIIFPLRKLMKKKPVDIIAMR